MRSLGPVGALFLGFASLMACSDRGAGADGATPNGDAGHEAGHEEGNDPTAGDGGARPEGIVENSEPPTRKDISVGQDYQTLAYPTALVDDERKKLLIVGWDAPSRSIALHTCALDGSNCARTKLAGTAERSSGPHAVIDAKNKKLIIAGGDTNSDGALRTLYLHRCDLDGSNCTSQYISNVLGSFPTVFLDEGNEKIFVMRSLSGAGTEVFRCGIDATHCARTRLGEKSSYPSAFINSKDGKLTIIADGRRDDDAAKSALISCNADMTGCAPAGSIDGTAPSYDPASTNLYAFKRTTGSFLTRCTTSGAECVKLPTSVEFPADAFIYRILVAADHIFIPMVVVTNQRTVGKLAITRCKVDGSACANIDVSMGKLSESGVVKPAVDIANARLLVPTDVHTMDMVGGKPSLVTMGLSYAP